MKKLTYIGVLSYLHASNAKSVPHNYCDYKFDPKSPKSEITNINHCCHYIYNLDRSGLCSIYKHDLCFSLLQTNDDLFNIYMDQMEFEFLQSDVPLADIYQLEMTSSNSDTSTNAQTVDTSDVTSDATEKLKKSQASTILKLDFSDNPSEKLLATHVHNELIKRVRNRRSSDPHRNILKDDTQENNSYILSSIQDSDVRKSSEINSDNQERTGKISNLKNASKIEKPAESISDAEHQTTNLKDKINSNNEINLLNELYFSYQENNNKLRNLLLYNCYKQEEKTIYEQIREQQNALDVDIMNSIKQSLSGNTIEMNHDSTDIKTAMSQIFKEFTGNGEIINLENLSEYFRDNEDLKYPSRIGVDGYKNKETPTLKLEHHLMSSTDFYYIILLDMISKLKNNDSDRTTEFLYEFVSKLHL